MPGALHAAVVVRDGDRDAAAYEMFDVESVDLGGARLVGPLLLEIGEEVCLRLSRAEQAVDVLARVTGVERGDHDAVSVVTFVDADAQAEQLRAVVSD